ncbi:hypothetical protein [Zobellia uliginosa]|uniref:hypothetical protein n=1 Tax=Zobellia uliginosa TaxID=143224 RepID=UPI001C073C35|nr:hypothetical protein [Zobellia uliginosa]MBU2948018.1 hypothetical protein [Zobellia uliginosa]
MDDWIWGYEKLNQFLPWHSSFMNNEDLKFLLKKNNSDFIRVISTSTLKNFKRILTFDYSIGKKFGGYKKMERTSTAEELRKEALHNPEIKDSIGISDNNIEYLQKMVDYCSQRNVNVYFIRSPQHQYYVRSNERQLMAIKIDKFKNIDLLDFDRFPLKAKYFADAGHLNASGATIFSNWFNGLLQKGLLTQKSKEDFVKKELETVKKIK